jgi:putative methyltransferase (TIGR04325 family)
MKENPIEKIIIWEGIFTNFNEIQRTENIYESERWLASNLERARQVIDEEGLFTYRSRIARDYPLKMAVLAALESNNRVSILDVGGGYGKHLMEIQSTFQDIESRIDFYILENSVLSHFYKMNIKLPDNVIFIQNISEIANFQAGVDVLHFGSVIQYFTNLKVELSEILRSSKARWIVFSDLMAGDIETFVTVQNYYGLRIPFRFVNFEELNTMVSDLGYYLLVKEFYEHDSTGVYFPQKGFDRRFQIDNSMNVIYRLND